MLENKPIINDKNFWQVKSHLEDIEDLQEWARYKDDPDYTFRKIIEYFEEVAKTSPDLMPQRDLETLKHIYWSKKLKEWIDEASKVSEL